MSRSEFGAAMQLKLELFFREGFLIDRLCRFPTVSSQSYHDQSNHKADRLTCSLHVLLKLEPPSFFSKTICCSTFAPWTMNSRSLYHGSGNSSSNTGQLIHSNLGRMFWLGVPFSRTLSSRVGRLRFAINLWLDIHYLSLSSRMTNENDKMMDRVLHELYALWKYFTDAFFSMTLIVLIVRQIPSCFEHW